MAFRRYIVFATLLCAAPALAEWRGYVGVESRLFLEDALYDGQHDHYLSVVAQPEYSREWDEGDQRLVFTPFLRLSQFDDHRTHADIRELYYERFAQTWELRAGLRQIFWGVTESQHLVDIINQTDLVENLDTEDKLGQPMIEFDWIKNWGTLKFFAMPYFRERTFPDREGRLRAPIPVETDEAEFDSAQEQWHTDFALRYSHYIGEWDLGLSYFYGTSRDPRLEPRLEGGVLELHPVYDLIHQGGVDLQWTHESWLWKFEGILREGQEETFAALTAGFEYTFYAIHGSNADIGILAEWLYDSRGKDGPSATDNDLFVAARLALNDVQSTQLLAGAIVDPDTLATFAFIEASRRLKQNWRLTLEGRAFMNVPRNDPAAVIRKDDFLQLELAYFF